MFKLTIHTGDINAVSLHTTLSKLEFGYEVLDSMATYKAHLFVAGVGAVPVFMLEGYPRWSVTVWDLVLRLLAKGLYTKAELPFIAEKPTKLDRAYASEMCATLEHLDGYRVIHRSYIGSAWIRLAHEPTTQAITYNAQLRDDVCGVRDVVTFGHAPAFLQPADLMARAICWSLYGSPVIPPMPALIEPPLVKATQGDGPTKTEEDCISIHGLPEPAKTGFNRYIEKHKVPTRRIHHGPVVAPKDHFMKFLRRGL